MNTSGPTEKLAKQQMNPELAGESSEYEHTTY